MGSTILWRRLDVPGHEFCSIENSGPGWVLAGTAVFSFEKKPCMLEYQVCCGADWQTRSADVEGRIDARAIRLSVAVDAAGRWTLNGAECPSVSDCTDIDLGFSPSTNLLPIRRLSLAVGESAEVRAAWLPFPALDLEPLPQTYVRVGEKSYRYESRDGAFVRTLDVNERGLVTKYPGLWESE